MYIYSVCIPLVGLPHSVGPVECGSLLGCGLWLVRNCTVSGGFETETLGMALLLLPDPVGLMGLSFSWITGYGFDSLTLGILGEGGGIGGGIAGCGSLGAWLLP